MALPPALRGESHADYAPGERQLLEATRRATTPGWAALVVHLGERTSPRPHHRRIAQSLLDDAAQRHGGQVFALRNGDLVLLCPTATLRAPATARSGQSANETLPELLARLLRPDGSEPVAPLTIWQLPEARDRLLAYAAERLADGGLTPLDQAMAETELPIALAAAEARLLPDLLQRQTAVQIGGGGGMRIQPLFREIIYANAALQAQAGGEAVEPDPFLVHHFAAKLEERVVVALPAEIGRHGALDPAAGAPLHLNLAPATVNGLAFAELLAACQRNGIGLGVEFSLVEAAADPEGFALARGFLRGAGITCAIDGVSPLALRLTAPATLGADLVKIDWSPRLARLAASELREVKAALGEIGAERLLLAGADQEEALHWGLLQGFRRFQGRHVDAMLAASRLATCPHASGCTLRQCSERALAVAMAGRLGCLDAARLDGVSQARGGAQ